MHMWQCVSPCSLTMEHAEVGLCHVKTFSIPRGVLLRRHVLPDHFLTVSRLS